MNRGGLMIEGAAHAKVQRLETAWNVWVFHEVEYGGFVEPLDQN